jgi:hypothetical protein
MSFMTEVDIMGVRDWPKLLHARPLVKLAPGIALGVFMLLAVRHVR